MQYIADKSCSKRKHSLLQKQHVNKGGCHQVWMKSVEIAAATLVRLSGLENENEERKVEKFSNGKMANRRRRQPTKCQNRMETSKYSSGQRCICAATIKLNNWGLNFVPRKIPWEIVARFKHFHSLISGMPTHTVSGQIAFMNLYESLAFMNLYKDSFSVFEPTHMRKLPWEFLDGELT